MGLSAQCCKMSARKPREKLWSTSLLQNF